MGVDKSSTNLPVGVKAGQHLSPVADNTVWSHWQVASRSSEVNFAHFLKGGQPGHVPRQLSYSDVEHKRITWLIATDYFEDGKYDVNNHDE